MNEQTKRIVELVLGGGEFRAAELAALTDAYKKQNAARLAADKVAAGLKEDETRIKQALIMGMQRLEVSAVGGLQFTATLSVEDEPTAQDWDKFYKHILKTKDFSLLERRVSKSAVKERWSLGETVPGITKFPVPKLSVTKKG